MIAMVSSSSDNLCRVCMSAPLTSNDILQVILWNAVILIRTRAARTRVRFAKNITHSRYVVRHIRKWADHIDI